MIIPVRIDKAAAETAAREGTGSDNNGDGGGGQMTATAENNNKGVCVPEWSMVELQGELICKDPLSGQPLGSMTSENGKPVLVISNHKLEGKAASEPKPLLVLRKVMVDIGDDESDSSTSGSNAKQGRGDTPQGRGEGGDSQPQQQQQQQQRQRVEYRVVGKVTRKTIFKTRPKPLIRKLGGGGPGGGSTARSCM